MSSFGLLHLLGKLVFAGIILLGMGGCGTSDNHSEGSSFIGVDGYVIAKSDKLSTSVVASKSVGGVTTKIGANAQNDNWEFLFTQKIDESYVVSVEDGYIDVDMDHKVSSADIKLGMTLKATGDTKYISPLTTLAYETNNTKLLNSVKNFDPVASILKADDDNTTKALIILNRAIGDLLKESNGTNVLKSIKDINLTMLGRDENLSKSVVGDIDKKVLDALDNSQKYAKTTLETLDEIRKVAKDKNLTVSDKDIKKMSLYLLDKNEILGKSITESIENNSSREFLRSQSDNNQTSLGELKERLERDKLIKESSLDEVPHSPQITKNVVGDVAVNFDDKNITITSICFTFSDEDNDSIEWSLDIDYLTFNYTKEHLPSAFDINGTTLNIASNAKVGTYLLTLKAVDNSTQKLTAEPLSFKVIIVKKDGGDIIDGGGDADPSGDDNSTNNDNNDSNVSNPDMLPIYPVSAGTTTGHIQYSKIEGNGARYLLEVKTDELTKVTVTVEPNKDVKDLILEIVDKNIKDYSDFTYVSKYVPSNNSVDLLTDKDTQYDIFLNYGETPNLDLDYDQKNLTFTLKISVEKISSGNVSTSFTSLSLNSQTIIHLPSESFTKKYVVHVTQKNNIGNVLGNLLVLVTPYTKRKDTEEIIPSNAEYSITEIDAQSRVISSADTRKFYSKLTGSKDMYFMLSYDPGKKPSYTIESTKDYNPYVLDLGDKLVTVVDECNLSILYRSQNQNSLATTANDIIKSKVTIDFPDNYSSDILTPTWYPYYRSFSKGSFVKFNGYIHGGSKTDYFTYTLSSSWDGKTGILIDKQNNSTDSTGIDIPESQDYYLYMYLGDSIVSNSEYELTIEEYPLREIEFANKKIGDTYNFKNSSYVNEVESVSMGNWRNYQLKLSKGRYLLKLTDKDIINNQATHDSYIEILNHNIDYKYGADGTGNHENVIIDLDKDETLSVRVGTNSVSSVRFNLEVTKISLADITLGQLYSEEYLNDGNWAEYKVDFNSNKYGWFKVILNKVDVGADDIVGFVGIHKMPYIFADDAKYHDDVNVSTADLNRIYCELNTTKTSCIVPLMIKSTKNTAYIRIYAKKDSRYNLFTEFVEADSGDESSMNIDKDQIVSFEMKNNNEWKYFILQADKGEKVLVNLVDTDDGNNLYVKDGSKPLNYYDYQYECKSTYGGNAPEVCITETNTTGAYYVGVIGMENTKGVVTATIINDSTEILPLNKTLSSTLKSGEFKYFRVPLSQAGTLKITKGGSAKTTVTVVRMADDSDSSEYDHKTILPYFDSMTWATLNVPNAMEVYVSVYAKEAGECTLNATFEAK